MKSAREAVAYMLSKLGSDVVVKTNGGKDVAFRDCPDAMGAVFSPCEAYRYLLWRIWDPAKPLWSFGMLNPSTADHEKLDPTVKRCCQRAMHGGAGGLVVWNLFAYRATKPEDMKAQTDPVGPFNDEAMLLAVSVAALNIAAWGVHGVHNDRDVAVLALLKRGDVPLHALDYGAAGFPRHPLYLSFDLQPQPWDYLK
jgi:hypothetical protein